MNKDKEYMIQKELCSKCESKPICLFHNQPNQMFKEFAARQNPKVEKLFLDNWNSLSEEIKPYFLHDLAKDLTLIRDSGRTLIMDVKTNKLSIDYI